MRIYPPEHRIDPCLHGLHAQGFDNIIISTDIEPFYHVILPIECRNEDDGNLRSGRILFHLMRHLESRHVLHHHIQKNQCVFRQIQLSRLYWSISQMSNSSSTTSIFINAQKVVNETDNYLGAKLPFFSETPEESVLNCYDNAPLRASFRALYSTSHR